MDWKLAVTTFGSILVAEIGDKTQLATMSLAAGGRSKLAVFVGAAFALCISTALGVLVGDGVTRVVPPLWIRRIAGLVFIAIGATFLMTATGQARTVP